MDVGFHCRVTGADETVRAICAGTEFEAWLAVLARCDGARLCAVQPTSASETSDAVTTPRNTVTSGSKADNVNSHVRFESWAACDLLNPQSRPNVNAS